MSKKKTAYNPRPFLLAKAIEIPGLRRRIWAHLPEGYNEQPDRRYPVVYLHDAQNIFEGWKAPFGKSWEVQDMFQTLTYAGFPQHELYLGIRSHGKHDEAFWQQEFETCYRWMMN